MPVEVQRGGTEATEPSTIQDPGQLITIHALEDGYVFVPDSPNLAYEFLK